MNNFKALKPSLNPSVCLKLRKLREKLCTVWVSNIKGLRKVFSRDHALQTKLLNDKSVESWK